MAGGDGDASLEDHLGGATCTKTEGTSKQEVIRRAVLERYERSGHASRIDSSAKRMTERWGDVLERLGTE